MKEKILLAISDVVLTNIIADKLRLEGYKIYIAIDGNDALAKMKTLSPNLILIDLVLSGRNGYEVLQEKSFDRLITKIPVIIISNSGMALNMRLIPSTPTIKDYLIKTHIDPEEVMEKISKAFGRKYIKHIDNVSDEQAIKANGKKILWVEDDKLLSTILSKKFEGAHYRLHKVDDGESAFKYLETEVPDLIILDIILPKMNGLDVLQKMRSNEKLRKVPVIMLSNANKQSDIEKANLLGVERFMLKAAVSLDEIMSVVDSLVK